MIYAVLIFWLISAIFIIRERRVYRMIIFLGAFSLINGLIYLLAGSPDVAMAEVAAGAFTTIFLIICFEKYYGFDKTRHKNERKIKTPVSKWLPPILFTSFLFVVFVYFMPPFGYNSYLKYQYITYAYREAGGGNVVGAVLLAFRMYDTVFEALILLVVIVAVKHVSFYKESYLSDGVHNEMERDPIAVYTIRAISPIILLFGIATTVNALDSPGGGFQGGVIIASFFIGRYLIYNVYDVKIKLIALLEKLIYIFICAVPIFVIFAGGRFLFPEAHAPLLNNIYLATMNTLLGMKVACGFVILFYRYIVIDRRI